MKNKPLLIWTSDFSSNTGEGILARAFLKEIQQIKKFEIIKIKTLEQEFFVKLYDLNKTEYKEINKNSFSHKYFGPIYGAWYLLLNSRKYQIMYLNYLPLWNFLIYCILPKGTILGPITGGVYNNQLNNYNLMIRKYLFPFFYKISSIIIRIKFKKIIFSTSILKNYVSKSKFLLFNFSFILFNKCNHITKKKYDIIFYNRNHPAKHSINIKKIIIELSKSCQICVIGDFFDEKKVKNFGWVKINKAHNLIKKSRLAINGAENFLSIFGIDSVNFGTPIIYDLNVKPRLKVVNNNYIRISFLDIKDACFQIKTLLSKFKGKKNVQWWRYISNEKKKIKNFLISYFV
jgi:hypothetical protein